MKVKNQHYVPRFYLKLFAFEKTKIWVYDKSTKSQFISSILNIAADNYFYDDVELDKKHNKEQYLENLYSEIEDKFAHNFNPILESIKHSDNFEISKNDRQIIANYLVTQIDRTKEHREETYQFTVELYNQLKDKGFNEDQLIKLGFETDQFNEKELHLESIISGNEMRETLAEILFEHIWVIFKNETKCNFYTSDVPIVKHGHLSGENRSEEGYGSPGIEIAFPLNPKYLLVLFDREYFYDMENWDGKILSLKKLENIEYYNSMQVALSYRQIFSNSNNFDTAKEMLKSNPELSNLQRKRIR
jgi:hypothetical protein